MQAEPRCFDRVTLVTPDGGCEATFLQAMQRPEVQPASAAKRLYV